MLGCCPEPVVAQMGALMGARLLGDNSANEANAMFGAG
jgi:hypothetical protein